MRKPRGYWRIWDNVEREMNKIIEVLGHFPNKKELLYLKASSLYNAINRYHGGCNRVIKNMGHEEPNKATKTQNKDWEYIKKEVCDIKETLGRYPKFKDFDALGRRDLRTAIYNHHGGLKKVRKRLGENQSNSFKKFKNVERELKKITKDIGHFPSSSYLQKNEVPLINAIYRYHGSYFEVRERMRYEPLIAKKGSLKDWNNVESKIKNLIKKLGRFPKYEELPISLAGAIGNYHDGINEVRKRMGYKELKKKNGFGKDWGYVENEINRLIKILGHFPETAELRKMKKYSLINAMYLHHDGLLAVREKMGYDQITSNHQFIDFLKNDEAAATLAAAAITLNGQGMDMEKVIMDIYRDKFGDEKDIHKFLEENTDEVYKVIRSGLTNLGAYLGDFTLEGNGIIPILIGQAIDVIPEGNVTLALEDRLVRLLRYTYGPVFNEDPEGTIKNIDKLADSYEGRKSELYQGLSQHYKDVLELGRELECLS